MSIKKSIKKIKILNNYFKRIKNSIIPQPYSHSVDMNILIKKGQQSGTALIPCTIYAMDHSIDLNPALIRKKDKKPMRYDFPKKVKYAPDPTIDTYRVNKNVVRYNPNNYVVELTDEEKAQGYQLKELDRCKKCGQKLVIAEMTQTRYRSCPSIHVKLGDKAKEDVVVPVKFGVNKTDITRWYWFGPFFIIACIWLTFNLFGIRIPILPPSIGNLPVPSWLLMGMNILCASFIWLYIVPRMLYKQYKLHSWYNLVKPTMKKTYYGKVEVTR